MENETGNFWITKRKESLLDFKGMSATNSNVVIDDGDRLAKLSGVYVQLCQTLGVMPVHDQTWKEIRFIHAIQMVTENRLHEAASKKRPVQMTMKEKIYTIYQNSNGNMATVIKACRNAFNKANHCGPPIDEFLPSDLLHSNGSLNDDYNEAWNNCHYGVMEKHAALIPFHTFLGVLESEECDGNEAFVDALEIPSPLPIEVSNDNSNALPYSML